MWSWPDWTRSDLRPACEHLRLLGCIRQHTSACALFAIYVSICQHMSAYVGRRVNTFACYDAGRRIHTTGLRPKLQPLQYLGLVVEHLRQVAGSISGAASRVYSGHCHHRRVFFAFLLSTPHFSTVRSPLLRVVPALSAVYLSTCWRMLTYADVRVLTYARSPLSPLIPALCWRMLTYADVCSFAFWFLHFQRCACLPQTCSSRLVTYADDCRSMLTYVDICWRMRT